MSASAPGARGAVAVRQARACEDCLRRGPLLAELSSQLDYCWRDRERLIELLALGDEDLVRAVAGRRKQELKARLEDLGQAQVGGLPHLENLERFCRHDRSYPRALSGRADPRLLYVAGGVRRLGELAAGPVVAIVGSRRASDYGMAMAKSLARGLNASAVTIVAGISDGIAVAAHHGSLEAGGRTVAVLPGGLGLGAPAKRRALLERIRQHGCALAELPCDCPPRRWGALASERIVAGMANVTVVVEAEEDSRELACARIAQDRGRTVAAMPGRVTSPFSQGTHALLVEGAPLVRGTEDVLELLHPVGCSPHRAGQEQARLEPRLQAVLARVGAGEDTAEQLLREGEDAGELLLALSELELRGLLVRGDAGRYVPRDAL